MDNVKTNKESGFFFFFRITGVLLIISALIALLLAFVNELTYEAIEKNKALEMQNAVAEIFPNADTGELKASDAALAAPVNAIYPVELGEGKTGYCVSVAPVGFKGEISMLVGVDENGAVVGVRIVTQSETPGLGSKVADAKYLEAYNGKTAGLEINRDIDAIAGATISSKAVLSGVEAALTAVGALKTGGVQGQ